VTAWSALLLRLGAALGLPAGQSQLLERSQVSDLVRAVIAASPFPAQAAQRAHLIRVIFLAAVPPPGNVSRLMPDDSLRETCRMIGSHFRRWTRTSIPSRARTSSMTTIPPPMFAHP